MIKYRCKDGDIIDAICYRYYGNLDMVEAVFDMNLGLCDRSPILTAGYLINLPDAAVKISKQKINLWD